MCCASCCEAVADGNSLLTSTLRDGKTNIFPFPPSLTFTVRNSNFCLGFQGQYDGKDGQDAECLDRVSALAGVTPKMSVESFVSFMLFMDDFSALGLLISIDGGYGILFLCVIFALVPREMCHTKGVFRPFVTSNAYQKTSLFSSTYPPNASSFS